MCFETDSFDAAPRGIAADTMSGFLGTSASPVDLKIHMWTYGTLDSDVIGVEGLWGFTALEELGTPRLVRVDQ